MELSYLKNCGVYINVNGIKIMVDGLNQEYRGYSSLEDKEFKNLFFDDGKFSDLDYLVFTHYHTDHYSKRRVEQYIDKNKDCKVVGPTEKGNFKYTDGKIALPGIEITGIDFAHSGNELADILHTMVFVKSDESNILLASDANFQDDTLVNKVQDATGENKVDVAFFNPLFIADQRGRDTLKELDATQTYIYHMPEGDNDPMKVKAFAMATFDKNFGNDSTVELLSESMKKLK